MVNSPIVTVAVPSLNQGRFLEEALESIFIQDLAVEVYVVDGGSKDESLKIIRRWERRLAGWRSYPDSGQAAAINEAIANGGAPFVCWLNSDDRWLPGALGKLVATLQSQPDAPAVYGNVMNQGARGLSPLRVEPFSEERLARRCIISQPGTLIRRASWNEIGGLREDLHMALDYDLWWRLYKQFGPLVYDARMVAVNRDHPNTKTNRFRRQHYREAIAVVREHFGRVPLRWWLAQPYSVWARGLWAMWHSRGLHGARAGRQPREE